MSMFPNIFGAYDTRDLPSLKVTDIPNGEEAVMADIRRWADYFNQVVGMYTDTFARVDTRFRGTFGNGGGGGEMQPYTEYGQTEATRTKEATWPVGFPIRRYRDRQMYTEEYLATKNLDQINRDVVYASIRNYTTRIKMIIRAIVGNANYTFDDGVFPGSDQGPINVYRLFNADAIDGSLFVNGAEVAVGTLQSYLPSGNAAVTIANFTLGRTGLRARGYTDRVFHLISPSDADTVRALTGFYPRVEANPLIKVDNANTPVTTAVVSTPQSIGVFSNGGVSDGEVIVFPFFPAGYTFSFDASKPKPVVIREHEQAQFRGFRMVQDETRASYGENSLRNKRWEYIAGAGVDNRANGIVVKATTGAYTVPQV